MLFFPQHIFLVVLLLYKCHFFCNRCHRLICPCQRIDTFPKCRAADMHFLRLFHRGPKHLYLPPDVCLSHCIGNFTVLYPRTAVQQTLPKEYLVFYFSIFPDRDWRIHSIHFPFSGFLHDGCFFILSIVQQKVEDTFMLLRSDGTVCRYGFLTLAL